MKPWRPDECDAVPISSGSRRGRRGGWSLEGYAPPRARPRHAGEARLGGWIGVALLALAATALSAGAVTLLAPPNPIDQLAVDP